MVAVRVIKHGVEVLADSIPTSALNIQRAQIAFLQASAGTSAVRVVKFGTEVMGDAATIAALNIQRTQVAFPQVSVGTSAVRVIRLGIEVMSGSVGQAALNIQRTQVAFSQVSVGTSAVRVIKHAVEVLADSPPTVDPNSFPAQVFDFFLHNWARTCRILNSWLTDITRSARTLSEERVQLRDKPIRIVELEWLVEGKEAVTRLTQHMRRLPATRLSLPLYPEQTRLNTSVSGPAFTVFCDTKDRRFFAGAIVVLAKIDPVTYDFTGEWLDRIISMRFNDKLTFTTSVPDLTAGEWLIFPVIETEVVLDPSYNFRTNEIVLARLTVEEIISSATLPAVQTGRPDGYQVHEDLPIWVVEPNWVDGVEIRLLREAEVIQQGKGKSIVLRGERHHTVHDYRLLFERPEFFKFLRLWDTSAGQRGAFWQVDAEDLWTAVNIAASGNFVDIMPIGDFQAFQEELGPPNSSGWLGLIFDDGTAYVREVSNITTFGGSWRVTLVDPFPLNLDHTQLRRVSRARKCKFFEDEMKEEWNTGDVCEVRVSTIELLEEKEVEVVNV